MMEPSVQTLAGDAPSRVFKRYFLAVRPMFLTASVLPVLAGSSWGAAQTGQLQVLPMLLAVISIALVHAAVNVLNDVYDDANGTDRMNETRIFPFTGGSRFIQNGVLSAEQMRQYARWLLAAGMALGVLLTLLKGPVILLFGLTGIALGVLYSAPPVALASRGLGELAVALGFGMLPVLGAVWLQTENPALPGLLLSIPISCWVANILIMNEIPDAVADARAGKATLVVRLGVGAARGLYTLLAVIAILAAALLAVYATLNLWGLIPLGVLLLISLRAAVEGKSAAQGQSQLKPAIQKTLTIHALGCLWLILWPWI